MCSRAYAPGALGEGEYFDGRGAQRREWVSARTLVNLPSREKEAAQTWAFLQLATTPFTRKDQGRETEGVTAVIVLRLGSLEDFFRLIAQAWLQLAG
jgi:hypothetical protein